MVISCRRSLLDACETDVVKQDKTNSGKRNHSSGTDKSFYLGLYKTFFSNTEIKGMCHSSTEGIKH